MGDLKISKEDILEAISKLDLKNELKSFSGGEAVNAHASNTRSRRNASNTRSRRSSSINSFSTGPAVGVISKSIEVNGKNYKMKIIFEEE